jgi:hypothetical protein
MLQKTFDKFTDAKRDELGSFAAIVKCIGTSTTHWNQCCFCDNPLSTPHGMMESWNAGILGIKCGKSHILQ